MLVIAKGEPLKHEILSAWLIRFRLVSCDAIGNSQNRSLPPCCKLALLSALIFSLRDRWNLVPHWGEIARPSAPSATQVHPQSGRSDLLRLDGQSCSQVGFSISYSIKKRCGIVEVNDCSPPIEVRSNLFGYYVVCPLNEAPSHRNYSTSNLFSNRQISYPWNRCFIAFYIDSFLFLLSL